MGRGCVWWLGVLSFQSSNPGQEFSLVQFQTPRCTAEISINSSLLPRLHSYLQVCLFLASAMLQVCCTLLTVKVMEERERRTPKKAFPKGKKNPTQKGIWIGSCDEGWRHILRSVQYSTANLHGLSHWSSKSHFTQLHPSPSQNQFFAVNRISAQRHPSLHHKRFSLEANLRKMPLYSCFCPLS